MERKPIYEFGEWIVKRQGELAGKARVEGERLGLTPTEIRKTLLIAFQTLGETAGISIRQLNQRIARRE
jgi:hypothetical protein